MSKDETLMAEAQATIEKINSGEVETVLLDWWDQYEVTATHEVMDLLLDDPDEAAEIMTQVKAFLRQLPPDEPDTVED